LGNISSCLHINVFDPVEKDTHDAGENGDSFSRGVIEQARGQDLMHRVVAIRSKGSTFAGTHS